MRTKENAIKLLIGLLSLVIVFHILVLLQLIPFHIAWGGRLKTVEEMYVFESVSIAINLILIGILSLKMKEIKSKIVNAVLWVFFAIFSVNTIANLFAETTYEKFFSILTLLFAILIFVILRKKKENLKHDE